MNVKKIRKFTKKHTHSSPEDALRYVNSLSDYLRDIQEGIFHGPRIDQLEDLESLIEMTCQMMGFKRDNFYANYKMTKGESTDA